MDLVKRIYHFVASVLLYAVFFIIAIIGICVLLYFADQFSANRKGVHRPPLFGAFVIVSNSMEPNIHVRDAVITMRKSVNKLKKGDIITFISKDQSHYGVTITHRIIGVFTNDDKSVSYRTKGDHNNVEDKVLVSYNDVLGKVMLRIPYIGYLQEFISTIYGWIILIVIPCVLIIASDIKKLITKASVQQESSKEDKAEKRGTKKC